MPATPQQELDKPQDKPADDVVNKPDLKDVSSLDMPQIEPSVVPSTDLNLGGGSVFGDLGTGGEPTNSNDQPMTAGVEYPTNCCTDRPDLPSYQSG